MELNFHHRLHKTTTKNHQSVESSPQLHTIFLFDLFLVYFHYFEKMNVDLCGHLAISVFVYPPYQLLNG
jgi:hypothetical protein